MEEEFNDVIATAVRIVEKLYSLKRRSDNRGIQAYKLFLSGLSFLIMTVFFILMTLSLMQKDSNKSDFKYAAYGSLISGLLLFTMLTVYESLRNSKKNIFRFKDSLKEEMQAMCEKENEVFHARGV